MNVLQSAVSTLTTLIELIKLIEFCLFEVGLCIVFIVGLYRHVRREVGRGD